MVKFFRNELRKVVLNLPTQREMDLFGDQEMDNFKDLKTPTETLKEAERKRLLESLESVLKKIEKNMDKMQTFGGMGIAGVGIAGANAAQMYNFYHGLGNSANVMAAPAQGEIERLAKTPLEAAMFSMFGMNGLYKKGPYRTNPLVSYYYNEQGASDILKKASLDIGNLGLTAGGIGAGMMLGSPVGVGLTMAGLPLLKTARNNLQSEMKTHSDLMTTAGSHVYGLNSGTIIGEGFNKGERQSIAELVKAEAYEDKWWDMGDVNNLLSTTTQSKMYRTVRDAEDFKTRFKEVLEASKKVSMILSQSLDEAGQTLSKQRLLGIYDIPTMKEFAIRQEGTRLASGLSRAETFNIAAQTATYAQETAGNKEVGAKMADIGTRIAGLTVSRYMDSYDGYLDDKHKKRTMEKAEENKAEFSTFLGQQGVDFFTNAAVLSNSFKRDANGKIVVDQNMVKMINNKKVNSFFDFDKYGKTADIGILQEINQNPGEFGRMLQDQLSEEALYRLPFNLAKTQLGWKPGMDMRELKTRIQTQYPQLSEDMAIAYAQAIQYSGKGSMGMDLSALSKKELERYIGGEAGREMSFWGKKASFDKTIENFKNNIVSPIIDPIHIGIDKFARKRKNRVFTYADGIQSEEENNMLTEMGLDIVQKKQKADEEYSGIDVYNAMGGGKEKGSDMVKDAWEYLDKKMIQRNFKMMDFWTTPQFFKSGEEMNLFNSTQKKEVGNLGKAYDYASGIMSRGGKMKPEDRSKIQAFMRRAGVSRGDDIYELDSLEEYRDALKERITPYIEEAVLDDRKMQKKLGESMVSLNKTLASGETKYKSQTLAFDKNAEKDSGEMMDISKLDYVDNLRMTHGSISKIYNNFLEIDDNEASKFTNEVDEDKYEKQLARDSIRYITENPFGDEFLAKTQDSYTRLAYESKNGNKKDVLRNLEYFKDENFLSAMYKEDNEKDRMRVIKDYLLEKESFGRGLKDDEREKEAEKYANIYKNIGIEGLMTTRGQVSYKKEGKFIEDSQKLMQSVIDQGKYSINGVEGWEVNALGFAREKQMEVVDEYLDSDKYMIGMNDNAKNLYKEIAFDKDGDLRDYLDKEKYRYATFTKSQALAIGGRIGGKELFERMQGEIKKGQQITGEDLLKKYIAGEDLKADASDLRKLIPSERFDKTQTVSEQLNYIALKEGLGLDNMEKYLEQIRDAAAGKNDSMIKNNEPVYARFGNEGFVGKI